MPTLEKRAYEVYARARVAGLGRVEAYEKAGYRPDHSSASRVERRPEVAARIAELRARDPDNADPAAVMARLLRLADTCDALGTVSALKEGRLALLEAHRLAQFAAAREEEEAYAPLPRDMSEEQWILRYGVAEDKAKVMRGEWRDEHARHGWRADDPAALMVPD